MSVNVESGSFSGEVLRTVIIEDAQKGFITELKEAEHSPEYKVYWRLRNASAKIKLTISVGNVLDLSWF